MMRQMVAGWLTVAVFSSTAAAESVPSFRLDYAAREATHIVVVDAEGVVLESWRGNLKAGDKLTYKAAAKPLAVVEVPGILESKVKQVTGRRRLLFLVWVKTGRGFNLAPAHFMPVMPAGQVKPDISLATVWVETGQCFAIYQWMNPGDGANLHPLGMTEDRLKKEILQIAGATK